MTNENKDFDYELEKLLAEIQRIRDLFYTRSKELNINVNNQTQTKIKKRSDLEMLIGSIPFLLMNQEIFQKNQDMADFAARIGIDIPSPEKKSKEDIMGRIISAIAVFDEKKIKELNKTIAKIKIHQSNSEINSNVKNSFFKDWDAAIKLMRR